MPKFNASPLANAVETKLSAPPVAKQPAVSLKPAPVVAPRVSQAAPQPTPQSFAKPAAEVAVARSIPVADPNAPQRVGTMPAPPSAPIAKTASPHPVMDGPSFGELLRRSLALRPR
jgi:hypothetical protein